MPEIKQWVNLHPADAATLRTVPGEGEIPPERCGCAITLRATVASTGELSGRRVFWGVQEGDGNAVARGPGGAPIGWDWVSGQGGFGAPGFYEKLVVTDESGVSETTFDVSEVGGDSFTIKAYTKNDDGSVRTELSSDTYVVWRQLYYQVTRMGASGGRLALPEIPDIDWTDLHAEYGDSRRPHCVRWSEVPAGTAVITRRRSLWNDDLTKAAGLEGYGRDYEPLVLKVSLVDLMNERIEEHHTFEVVRNEHTYTYVHPHALFDVNSPDDRDDWFVSAAAFRHGHRTEAVEMTVGRENFHKTDVSTIEARFTDRPTCRLADVEVTINVFSGSTAGLSWYNGIWVKHAGVRQGSEGHAARIEEMTATDRLVTMVHEFGHALGMVPGGTAGGESSPFHYGTSHTHRGNHCWNGARDPSTFPAADPFPSPPGAVCTMFGDISAQTVRFCDTCSPFVRSRRPRRTGNFRLGRMMPANPASW